MQQIGWTIELGSWERHMTASAFAAQLFAQMHRMENPDRAELLLRLQNMEPQWWAWAEGTRTGMQRT